MNKLVKYKVKFYVDYTVEIESKDNIEAREEAFHIAEDILLNKSHSALIEELLESGMTYYDNNEEIN